MAYKEGTVLKHQIAFFAKTTAEADSFSRISKGFTDLSGALNPTTETSQYIGEATQTTTTTSYNPNYTFTAERYCGDVFNDYLYEIGRDQVLNATVHQIVRVDMSDPTESPNEYNAVAAEYNVSIDTNDTGAAGAKVGYTGTLSQKGDLVKGKYNTSTNTFTPNE